MSIKKGQYIHFKGNEYEVIGSAIHSETLEAMVAYRALYGDDRIWVRQASMWEEMVEHNGKTVKRFTRKEDFIGELINEKESATSSVGVNHYSSVDKKIALFLSLFEGRGDMFAKR
jgi:hypothetical protein